MRSPRTMKRNLRYMLSCRHRRTQVYACRNTPQQLGKENEIFNILQGPPPKASLLLVYTGAANLILGSRKEKENGKNEKDRQKRRWLRRNNIPGGRVSRYCYSGIYLDKCSAAMLSSRPLSCILQTSYFFRRPLYGLSASLKLNNFASCISDVSNMQVHSRRTEDSRVKGKRCFR